MSTASAFNSNLTGSYRFEANEAVSLPVPGIPGASRLVFVNELLEKVAELSKRVITLERRNERAFATANANRRKMARAQERHPLDRTVNTHDDGLLLQSDGDEDLLSLHNEGAADELVDAALAEQAADRACHAGD